MNYNIPFQQNQNYQNPYAGLFSIIGTIMGENNRARNEAGKVAELGNIGGQLAPPQQSLAEIQQLAGPQQQVTPQAVQGVQERMKGLLPMDGLAPQPIAAMQTPQERAAASMMQPGALDTVDPAKMVQNAQQQTQLQVPQQYQQQQPTQQSALPPAQAQPPQQQEQAQAPAKPMAAPSKTDIQASYQTQGKTAIANLVKQRRMSYAEAKALVDTDVKEKTDIDFNKKADAFENYNNGKLIELAGQDFSTNASKSKALGGILQYNINQKRIGRTGVDMAAFKELMAVPTLTFTKMSSGDGEQLWAHNSDGSVMVPVGPKFTKPDMNAFQRASLALRQKELDQKRPAGELTPAELATTYRWALSFTEVPTGKMDIYGKPEMTRVQNNPQLAAKLAGKLGFGPPQQEGPAGPALPPVQPTGNSDIDSKISNMRAKGAPEQLINDMVWEEQNKQGPQQPNVAPQAQAPAAAPATPEVYNNGVRQGSWMDTLQQEGLSGMAKKVFPGYGATPPPNSTIAPTRGRQTQQITPGTNNNGVDKDVIDIMRKSGMSEVAIAEWVANRDRIKE